MESSFIHLEHFISYSENEAFSAAQFTFDSVLLLQGFSNFTVLNPSTVGVKFVVPSL